METRLQYIISNVNDWLKFAETKHAALLVAISTFYVIIVDHFPNKNYSCIKYDLWLSGSLLIFISGICSMISFIPFLKFSWGKNKGLSSAMHNLFYFGDIAKYSAFEYLNALYNAQLIESPNNKIELDLAGQAVTNSQIAVYKYRTFTASCSFAFLGLISVAISYLLEK